jgi:hypothetical protein
MKKSFIVFAILASLYAYNLVCVSSLERIAKIIDDALEQENPVSLHQELAQARIDLEKAIFEPHQAYSQLTLDQKVDFNDCKDLLATMYIEGLGGPAYPDDGVRIIIELLNTRASHPDQVSEFIQNAFISNAQNLLTELENLIKTRLASHPEESEVDNLFLVRYALALLYSQDNEFHDQAKARELLRSIIAQKNTDIALKNKARVLMIKILLSPENYSDQQSIEANNITIGSLLRTIVGSSYDTHGEFIGNSFPEDAEYAKATQAALFPGDVPYIQQQLPEPPPQEPMVSTPAYQPSEQITDLLPPLPKLFNTP